MDLCVYSIVVFDVAGMSVCVCVWRGGGRRLHFQNLLKRIKELLHIIYII